MSKLGSFVSFVVSAVILGCASQPAPNPNLGDIIVADAGPPPTGQTENGGYEFIARRPLAIVALAEARNIQQDEARALVNRVADALDTCVTESGRGGSVPQGAGRVVIQYGSDGNVLGTNLKFDPGEGVVAVGLRCLVAPLKWLSLSHADAAVRGVAIEALWGTLPDNRPVRPPGSAPSP